MVLNRFRIVRICKCYYTECIIETKSFIGAIGTMRIDRFYNKGFLYDIRGFW